MEHLIQLYTTIGLIIAVWVGIFSDNKSIEIAIAKMIVWALLWPLLGLIIGIRAVLFKDTPKD